MSEMEQDAEKKIPTGPGGCRAALNLVGEHVWCDQRAPHPGIPHGSSTAHAVWCGVGAEEDFQAAWAKADPEGER